MSAQIYCSYITTFLRFNFSIKDHPLFHHIYAAIFYPINSLFLLEIRQKYTAQIPVLKIGSHRDENTCLCGENETKKFTGQSNIKAIFGAKKLPKMLWRIGDTKMLKSHTKSVAGAKKCCPKCSEGLETRKCWNHTPICGRGKKCCPKCSEGLAIKKCWNRTPKMLWLRQKKLPKMLLSIKQTSIHRILYNHHAFIHAEKWAKNAAHLIRRENGVIISHK